MTIASAEVDWACANGVAFDENELALHSTESVCCSKIGTSLKFTGLSVVKPLKRKIVQKKKEKRKLIIRSLCFQ